MASPDPFGRAIRDFYLDEQETPLIQRDGPVEKSHPIEEYYFGDFPNDANQKVVDWLDSWIEGPLLDMGAGVGKHTLYFQEQLETVAIEVSDQLLETMTDRGVQDARHIDMFGLAETFERDRFGSALGIGTQLGLAKSMEGLRDFLGDLAFVTTPDATAVLDCYDPTCDGTRDLMGYRHDPTRGLAYRVMHFEYEGDIGETLLFRLFSPSRIEEATTGTPWDVRDTLRNPGDNSFYYRIALGKPQR